MRLGPDTALDEALAAIGWDELLCGSVQLLRAEWRIETGDAARGAEAIALLDEMLTRERSRENYYHRIRAAIVAGEDEIAWVGIQHFMNARLLQSPGTARRLLALSQRLGEVPSKYAKMIATLQQAARRGNRP